MTETTSIPTGVASLSAAPQSSTALPSLGVIALNRLAFGPRRGDLQGFNDGPGATPREKLHAFVNEQLAPDRIDDHECNAYLAASNLGTLHKSLRQCWHDNYVALRGNDPNAYIKQYEPVSDVKQAAFIRALYSRRQLYEVMVDFWHDHFNTAPDRDGNLQPVFMHFDRDVIRLHALGNFRQMLEGVATSPEMLYYLDNASSSRAGPNENFARELFELHTLGAENYLGVHLQQHVPGFAEGAPIGYVDNDVYEATRCFTGWRVDDDSGDPGMHNTGTFLFYPDWHDRFEKTVLGHFLPPDQAPMKDGHDVLDLLANHPGTGRFIARKLCRRLINDNPPESIVQKAALVFHEKRYAPDQIAQVVRTIALSDEFAATWGNKVKRPFEIMVSALRATEAKVNLTQDFFWYYDRLGQPMFGWLPPNGYPDNGYYWSGTSSMLSWWNFASDLTTNNVPGVSVSLVNQTAPSLRTPARAVAYWSARLLGRPLESSVAHDTIVNFLAQGGDPHDPIAPEQIADVLPKAISLILMSPDFRWR